MRWYHGTSRQNAEKILKEGVLKPGEDTVYDVDVPRPDAVYIADWDVAHQYALERNGVVIEIAQPDPKNLIPDEDDVYDLLDDRGELNPKGQALADRVQALWLRKWNEENAAWRAEGHDKKKFPHYPDFEAAWEAWGEVEFEGSSGLSGEMIDLTDYIVKNDPQLAKAIIELLGKAAHIGPIKVVGIAKKQAAAQWGVDIRHLRKLGPVHAAKTGQPIEFYAYHATGTGNVKSGVGGTFFSDTPAPEYGENIAVARLRFNNPLVLTDQYDALEKLLSPERAEKFLLDQADGEVNYLPIDRDIAEAAKAAGHDGIIYTEVGGLTEQEYVALDPSAYSDLNALGAYDQKTMRVGAEKVNVVKTPGFVIEVPKERRQKFFVRPKAPLEYWAFKNRPRVFLSEKLIFTFGGKPVAEAVVARIEAPGHGEGEHKHWHKVYWKPTSFRKFRVAATKLYHGSRVKFKPGDILTPQPGGYVHDTKVAEHEEIMEKYRPKGALPRKDSVYMVAHPDDVDYAGGYEDYIYEVKPVGKVEKCDMSWYSEVSVYGEYQPNDPNVIQAAKNYWAGKPFGGKSGLWEYRAPKAKVVRLVSSTKLASSKLTVPWKSDLLRWDKLTAWEKKHTENDEAEYTSEEIEKKYNLAPSSETRKGVNAALLKSAVIKLPTFEQVIDKKTDTNNEFSNLLDIDVFNDRDLGNMKEYYDEVAPKLAKLRFPLTVYRCFALRDREKIDYKNLGGSWSLNSRAAYLTVHEMFDDEEYEQYPVITGKITSSDAVDWLNTVRAWMTLPEEEEIRMRPGAKVKVQGRVRTAANLPTISFATFKKWLKKVVKEDIKIETVTGAFQLSYKGKPVAWLEFPAEEWGLMGLLERITRHEQSKSDEATWDALMGPQPESTKTANEMTENPDYYMTEGCGIWAVNFARKNGGEIYILSAKRGEGWSEEIPYEVTHAFVKNEGKTYDIRGERTPDKMAWELSMGEYSVKGPWTPDEFEAKFMGSDDDKPLFGKEGADKAAALGDQHHHKDDIPTPLHAVPKRPAVIDWYSDSPDVAGKEPELVEIDPKTLLTDQDTVSKSHIDKILGHIDKINEPTPSTSEEHSAHPLVLGTSEGDFVFDGNHRCAAALLKGLDIKVLYLDLAPIEDWVPEYYLGEEDEEQGKTGTEKKADKIIDVGEGDEYWAGEGNAASGVLPVCPSTGRVCLAMRSDDVHMGGVWGTIGGAVKDGMNPQRSAKSEMAEETGYHGGISLTPAYVFKDRGFTYHNFLGTVSSEFSFSPGERHEWETDRIVWVPYAEVLADIEKNPGDYHPGLLKLFANSKDAIERALKIEKKTACSKIAWQEIAVEEGENSSIGSLLGGVLENDKDLAAWAEQEIVSPALTEMPKRRKFMKQFKGMKVGVIDDMHIYQRGKGHGSKMLEDFIKRCKAAGCSAVLLQAGVYEPQQAGFSLVEWYERHGFKTMEISGGLPLMVKWLKPQGKKSALLAVSKLDRARVIDMIQKLQAHADSAARIGNEAEAKTFADKIKELRTAYGLDDESAKPWWEQKRTCPFHNCEVPAETQECPSCVKEEEDNEREAAARQYQQEMQRIKDSPYSVPRSWKRRGASAHPQDAEFRAAAEALGIEYLGPIGGLAPGEGVLVFQDPVTQGSLGVPENQWSPERLKERLERMRKKFGAKTGAGVMESRRPCPSGKRKFFDEVSAVGPHKEWDPGTPTLHTYKCPRCGWFHLTRQPQKTTVAGQTHMFPSSQDAKFQAWFDGSKVVDKNGNPMPVYHGTRSSVEFEEFSMTGPEVDDWGESSSSGSGADPTALMGAHFAEEPNVANLFAEGKGWTSTRYEGEAEKPRVIQVFLRITNPKDFGSEHNLREFINQGKVRGDAVDLALAYDLGVEPWEEGNEEAVSQWYEKYENDAAFRAEQNRYLFEQHRNVEGDAELLEEAAYDLASQAKSRLTTAGHDGVRYKNVVEGGHAWIAFAPDQIKSVYSQFNPKDPRFTASKNSSSYPAEMSPEETINYVDFLHEFGHGGGEPFEDPEWIREAEKYVLQTIPLDDPGVKWPKATHLPVAQEYAQRKTPLPPIIIAANGYVIDGFHRVEAARMRGDKTIQAYVGVKDASKDAAHTPKEADWRSKYVLPAALALGLGGAPSAVHPGEATPQQIEQRQEQQTEAKTKAEQERQIDALIEAISRAEGANPLFNNPGNITDFNTGKIRTFDSWDKGRDALEDQLNRIADGDHPSIRPDMTLREAGLIYSNGDPNWAKNVSSIMRVSQSIRMGELIRGRGTQRAQAELSPGRTGTWAKKAAGFAFKTFKKLWHVGSMDVKHKQEGSLEGSGLSVSVNPEEWMQIAEIGGDTWELTKPGNRFLNFHRLSKQQRQQIMAWGVENGYATEVSGAWRLVYYDSETDEERYMEFLSKEEAEAELGNYGDDEKVVPVDGKTVSGTDKLKQRTKNPHADETAVAFDLLVTVYAEDELDCDGVWWQDTLDPASLSAPRGVIFPSKLKSWKAKKIQTAATEWKKLPPTDEWINRAKLFLKEKWEERHRELGREGVPIDLGGACKFASIFAQKLFGGKMVGTAEHQALQLPGNRIIDLTDLYDPNTFRHDKEFWMNPEHAESMKSCEPRAQQWADEFMQKWWTEVFRTRMSSGDYHQNVGWLLPDGSFQPLLKGESHREGAVRAGLSTDPQDMTEAFDKGAVRVSGNQYTNLEFKTPSSSTISLLLEFILQKRQNAKTITFDWLKPRRREQEFFSVDDAVMWLETAGTSVMAAAKKEVL